MLLQLNGAPCVLAIAIPLAPAGMEQEGGSSGGVGEGALNVSKAAPRAGAAPTVSATAESESAATPVPSIRRAFIRGTSLLIKVHITQSGVTAPM